MKMEDICFVSCLGYGYLVLLGIYEDIGQCFGVFVLICDLIVWVFWWVLLVMSFGNVIVWIYKDRKCCGKVWDYVGVMLLFEEVGGKIICVFGKKISLKSGWLMEQNFGFVVGLNSEVFNDFLMIMRQVIQDVGYGYWLEEKGFLYYC